MDKTQIPAGMERKTLPSPWPWYAAAAVILGMALLGQLYLLSGYLITAGLAIALGGIGVNLEGLVQLYAAIARGGEVRPLTALAGVRSESGAELEPDAVAVSGSESAAVAQAEPAATAAASGAARPRLLTAAAVA